MPPTLNTIKSSKKTLAERSKAIQQSWNSKIKGLSRSKVDVDFSIAYAGIDDAFEYLGLNPPRRMPKFNNLVQELIKKWESRLHQGAEYGMLHEMSWEFGEQLAEKRKK